MTEQQFRRWIASAADIVNTKEYRDSMARRKDLVNKMSKAYAVASDSRAPNGEREAAEAAGDRLWTAYCTERDRFASSPFVEP